jgi:hypothetical protein
LSHSRPDSFTSLKITVSRILKSLLTVSSSPTSTKDKGNVGYFSGFCIDKMPFKPSNGSRSCCL